MSQSQDTNIQKPRMERRQVGKSVEVWIVNGEKSMLVAEFTGMGKDNEVAAGHACANAAASLEEGETMKAEARPEAGNWIAILGRWAFKVGTREECGSYAWKFNNVAKVVLLPIITGPGWYKLRNGGWVLNPAVIYNEGVAGLGTHGRSAPEMFMNLAGRHDVTKETGADIIRAATAAEARALNALNEGAGFAIVHYIAGYVPEAAEVLDALNEGRAVATDRSMVDIEIEAVPGVRASDDPDFNTSLPVEPPFDATLTYPGDDAPRSETEAAE